MSTVTEQTAPTTAELIAAFGLAVAGQLTPEAASAMLARLAGASASRSATARAAGRKGGRPAGRVAWYRVEDAERGTAWTQDLGPVAEWLGISSGSIQTYLTRGRGRLDRVVQRDGRDVNVTVRRCDELETAWCKMEQPEPWSPPAVAKPSHKSALRFRKTGTKDAT